MTERQRRLIRWLWHRGRPAALGFALTLTVAVLAATHRARTRSESCTSCHTTARHSESWRASGGHESFGCQSCHETTSRSALRLVLAAASGTTPERHADVDAKSCTNCHDGKSERSRLVADTSGHREHANLDEVTCLSCHGDGTHGATRASARCIDCHDDDRLHHGVAESESCTTCHNFSLDDQRERLTATECSRCHADRKKLAASSGNGGPAAGMLVTGEMLHGGVDCKLCHQPHRAMPKERGPTIPASVTQRSDANGTPDHDVVAGGRVCRQCHQIQVGGRGKPVPEGHTNCVKCHAPHAPIEQFVVACKECHEEARPKEQGPLSTALHHESCASCHVPHTWQAARSGCVQCHDEKAAILLASSPAEHQQCQSCHEPHSPLPKGDACVSCHKTKSGHLALAPGKHKNCASCHDPHRAKQLPRAACAGCHTGQNKQLVASNLMGHTKAGCSGCHQPHNSPAPKPTLCASCHQQKGTLVAKAEPDKHRDCASCHQPHRFQVTNPSAPCSKCHQSISKAPGPHDGACNKCHAEHGSPRVAQSACNQCHSEIHLKPPPGSAQHATCSSCHEPHKSAAVAVSQCSSCHQDKSRVAAAWPPKSAHAGVCNQCHQPHAVRDVKSCASCHSKQATSAKGGKHRCQQCHSPHQPPPGAGSAWWQRCATCHSSVTKQANAGVVHANCSNCHKPHRFTPPNCSSCHKNETSKAGHTVKGHQKCGDCHSTHQATLPERAQCLRCHNDMAQHQAGAGRCQACHPFK